MLARRSAVLALRVLGSLVRVMRTIASHAGTQRPRRAALPHFRAWLAATPWWALDGARAKLERRMLRTQESKRDSRHRLKKYYAASQVTNKGA